MIKTKAILIAVVVCTMASVCWGQSYWKRTFGGTGDFRANAITSSPDGNFIIAGYTDSLGAGNYNVCILKITPYGDTLWTKTYRGNGVSGASAIAPTSDGNFIVAGHIGYDDTYLLKITSDGDILWTRNYNGEVHGSAYAITATPDGNFIIAGNTLEMYSGTEGAYLIKVTPEGDVLWIREYTKTEWQGVSAITPTHDGNFIVTGWTRPFSTTPIGLYIYLLKITSTGETLWTRTYGGLNDWATAIISAPDGNFMVAGNCNNGVYFLKITPYGDTQWTRTYGEYGAFAYAITPTPDEDFMVAGTKLTTSGIGYDIYFLKIKPNGDSLWTKTFGGADLEKAYAITPTPNGDFILAGQAMLASNMNLSYIYLLSIINDRYAYKDSLFTFKIPVSGDSLNHGYTVLKVPSGMSVSTGGTIFWTPKTDSVYMDHVEFLVADDYGNKDTLTFNIFVNSSYHPAAIKPISHLIANKNRSFSINQTLPSQIKFNLSNGTSSLDIYDINGRCIQSLKPVNAQVVWSGLNSAGRPVSSGRYFAKIKDGSSSRMAEFSVVK